MCHGVRYNYMYISSPVSFRQEDFKRRHLSDSPVNFVHLADLKVVTGGQVLSLERSF